MRGTDSALPQRVAGYLSAYICIDVSDGVEYRFGNDFMRVSARLEGAGRERFGGVWEAPRHYTLNSSRADQTELTLQLQLDADLWTPSALSISNIVPWLNRLGTASDGKPLLTTCTDADVYWFGTIVTATSDQAGVSPWIS